MQEKTLQDVKRMRHNTGLKARQDEESSSGSQFPRIQMKKVVSHFFNSYSKCNAALVGTILYENCSKCF